MEDNNKDKSHTQGHKQTSKSNKYNEKQSAAQQQKRKFR